MRLIVYSVNSGNKSCPKQFIDADNEIIMKKNVTQSEKKI